MAYAIAADPSLGMHSIVAVRQRRTLEQHVVLAIIRSASETVSGRLRTSSWDRFSTLLGPHSGSHMVKEKAVDMFLTRTYIARYRLILSQHGSMVSQLCATKSDET